MPNHYVTDFLYEEDSYKIRGACFRIWHTFKGVFKEKVTERALKKELEDLGFSVEQQKRIDIYYKGVKVGTYNPDLIVNECILLELKSKEYLTDEDKRQFWYYLRGSDYKLGFLINFGPKNLEIKRRVYDKARQKYLNVGHTDFGVNQRSKSA